MPECKARRQNQGKARFGAFEVDFEAREVRKRGIRINLQEKPLQILQILLEATGGLVTRKQLIEELWPGTYVGFDHCLNTAINSLRRTLADSPRNPRFLETKPGLGYRFIAPIEWISDCWAKPQRMPETYTANPEVYELYLRGQYLATKMTEPALAMSVAQFEAALRIDSTYALAHSGLANVYTLYAFLNILPAREVLPRAKEHALHALRLDDDIAHGHAALASVMKAYEWDWAGAESEYRRALDLDPNYAAGHRFYADHLSAAGRHEQALREMDLAHKLDPLSPAINMEMAWIRYMARDYAGAVKLARSAMELEPGFAPSVHVLGLAHTQLDQHPQAISALQTASELSERHPTALAALAHAYACAAEAERAAEMFRDLKAASRYRYVSPYCIAFAAASMGIAKQAVTFLEAACEDRDVWLAWLKVDPRFDSLRSDSRFRSVLRRVGLPGEPTIV